MKTCATQNDAQDEKEWANKKQQPKKFKDLTFFKFFSSSSRKVEKRAGQKTTCDQKDDRNHQQGGNYSIVYGWLPLPETVIGAHLFFLTRGKRFSSEDGGSCESSDGYYCPKFDPLLTSLGSIWILSPWQRTKVIFSTYQIPSF